MISALWLYACFSVFSLTPVLKADNEKPVSERTDTRVKKSRVLAACALISTAVVIGFDALAEANYEEYKRETDSDRCVEYRERTVLLEGIRDGFLYPAIGCFAASIVFARLEKKHVYPKIGLLEGGGASVEICFALQAQ